MLNIFREPQRAVLEVQRILEGETPASALFADLSKAFERVNAYWILHILHIRQCSSWVLQLAKYLLFGNNKYVRAIPICLVGVCRQLIGGGLTLCKAAHAMWTTGQYESQWSIVLAPPWHMTQGATAAALRGPSVV